MEESIQSTDAYAKTRIDGIYQGINWVFSGILIEYKAGSIALMTPYGGIGTLGVIGRLRYSLAAALVLTAIAGTPAASSPATCTASHAILAAGFPVKLLHGPTLRKIPMRMDLLPYTSGMSVIHLSQT